MYLPNQEDLNINYIPRKSPSLIIYLLHVHVHVLHNNLNQSKINATM